MAEAWKAELKAREHECRLLEELEAEEGGGAEEEGAAARRRSKKAKKKERDKKVGREEACARCIIDRSGGLFRVRRCPDSSRLVLGRARTIFV